MTDLTTRSAAILAGFAPPVPSSAGLGPVDEGAEDPLAGRRAETVLPRLVRHGDGWAFAYEVVA